MYACLVAPGLASPTSCFVSVPYLPYLPFSTLFPIPMFVQTHPVLHHPTLLYPIQKTTLPKYVNPFCLAFTLF